MTDMDTQSFISQAPPYITPELVGIGGEIKASPAHFAVQELPLYPASGQGEHVYLTLEREGRTTRDLVTRLAAIFAISADAIGYAGLKDKVARVRQTFSLHLPGMDPQAAAARAAEALAGLDPAVTVAEAGLHSNKLKVGHLLGNRFTIVVSGVGPEALAPAQAIAAAITERGLPNFFGPQRFGRQGDNASQGLAVLRGRGPREKWLRKLVVSAWQAEVFNRWLATRLAAGDFARLIVGDVAKKTETGGIFTVENADLEQPRLVSGEITYTGPLFGKKMRWAQAEAGRCEQEALAASGVDEAALKRHGPEGGRRVARLWPQNLAIAHHPEGLVFDFSLAKGAYATVLLGEFMKTAVPPIDE